MLLSGYWMYTTVWRANDEQAQSSSIRFILTFHMRTCHDIHSYPFWHLRRGSKPDTPLVCLTVSVTTPTAVLLMPTLPCRAEGTTSEQRGPCSTAVAYPFAPVCPPAKLAAYT